MEECVDIGSGLDDLLKKIIACLPQIKRQLSGEQPSDYIGHIHVHVASNSQKGELEANVFHESMFTRQKQSGYFSVGLSQR
jgi:hypothetical protein